MSILVSYTKHVGRILPDSFQNLDGPIFTMDQRTKKWVEINIDTVKEIKLEEYTCDKSHVLAYFSEKKRDGHGSDDWTGYHCVFVKGRLLLQGDAFDCVNSWGTYNRNPVVEADRPGNRLWVVQVKCNEAPAGLFGFK